MRRVEPAFPDLLPVTHRLGGVPLGAGGLALDPVSMRLVREREEERGSGDGHVPRRPVRFLVHAEVARARGRFFARLLEAGCGAVVILDSPLAPEDLPDPLVAEQITVMNVWLPPFWGSLSTLPLLSFREAGFATGTLVALAPHLPLRETMAQAVHAAQESGAGFVVLAPLLASGEEKHAALERAFGEEGNGAFEDLLFHTDPADLGKTLEVHGSALAREAGLAEGLAGPAASLCKASCYARACALLLWARRLDLLDGVSSQGWRLRRAAQALLVSGRDPAELMEEDNLRLVPGFDPWVEAFARTLWTGEGEPFASLWIRWLEQAT